MAMLSMLVIGGIWNLNGVEDGVKNGVIIFYCQNEKYMLNGGLDGVFYAK